MTNGRYLNYSHSEMSQIRALLQCSVCRVYARVIKYDKTMTKLLPVKRLSKNCLSISSIFTAAKNASKVKLITGALRNSRKLNFYKYVGN